MHIILDDDFCTYLALATDGVLPRLGPLADSKTLLRPGVLLTTTWACPLEGQVEDLTVVGLPVSAADVLPPFVFQACDWSSLQIFCLPSVLVGLPMCRSPSLRLELWAHKLAACAEWVALVVAHDPRTSPTAASASFEAQSTAMVSEDGVWRDEPAQADRFTRIHSLLGNEHLRRLHKRQERRLAHLLVRAGRFRQLRRLLHLADADLLYGNFILQNG